MIVYLAAGLVMAAAIFSLVFFGSALVGGGGRGNIAGRLSKYSEVKVTSSEDRKAKKRDRTKATEALVNTIDRIIANQSFAEKLRTAIARADLKFTVGEFLILWMVAFIFGIFLGQVIFKTLPHTIIFGAVGLIGPRFFLRYRAGKRLKKFETNLADTVVMMANSLRSGYSVLQSMELISREMPPPTSDEFARVIKEVQIGLSPEEALANMVRRLKSLDLEMVVIAINVQREIGGNLSVILDTIAHTIRERIRIRREIQTLTAQARLSGYIITIMPLGLAFILYTIDQKYISFFWQDTGCGLPMMLASLLMMGLGFWVMRKIVSAIEV